ncbi:MAG: LamG domain-containing protein, partial [Terriglobales bacterium]
MVSASLDGTQNFTLTLAPSPDNPLAADWKLNESSGATSFADASANGNSGSCGSSCPTLGTAGRVGTAASFNGSSQIIVPDSPSLRLNQFTIALWVFPTQVKSDYQLLVAKEDSSAANRNYALYVVPNSLQLRYSVWAGDCATKLGANSIGQMTLNTWNYIVFTYDGVTADLYLNGVLDSASAASLAGLCQAAVPVKIGMETSAFLPFSGTLDDIQIYPQALTAAQVASIYNPLAAVWKLNEPFGASSFADASGDGNSGSCGSACPTLGVVGRLRTAASFNGSSQIIVPDSPS